jgi:hypothetical protein
MIHTAQILSGNNQDHPILIVDRRGEIGEALAKELKEQALVVFVSRKISEIEGNIVSVPFDKQFPIIPDNSYSHIFLIDEDFELVKDVIKPFLKKAEQDQAFLVLAANADFVEKNFPLDYISSYDKAKLVLFGDIFKEDKIYDPRSDINKYLAQIKTSGRIDVPGEGTRLVAPVLFEDVIFGILETVFGTEENKIFYLFPKHQITLLSLAHIFQRLDPELKIDFVKDENLEKEFRPMVEGKYLLGESYDLDGKLKKIKIGNIKVETVLERKILKPKVKNKFMFKPLILAAFLLLILPLLTTVIFAVLGLGSLLITKNTIEKGDLSTSKTSASVATDSFTLAHLSLQALILETKLVNLDNVLNPFSQKIDLGNDISNMVVSSIDAVTKFKSILTGTAKDPLKDFSSATMEIKNALYNYNNIKQAKIIPASFSSQLDNLSQIISSTIDFWPDAFGFNGAKNYLIIFQNNMELRPGGGFIGSYALLTINKGKIASFKVYDVYDADGQLRGHIEPPYPIRRYLPSVHWYLRDSNFNVDFSKGAVASAVFLNTEMHQAVDGVIGIDLSFVKNLLLIVGPVKVPDYNQTITSDNFYQTAQAHSEDNFFPGSTQKKDFLTSFYNALENKLTSGSSLSYLTLAQRLIQLINQKHVLFAFNNAGEQAAFAVNGWSSALTQTNVLDSSIANDFVGINEANLGGNKVNYYITRSISQSVQIKSDQSINEALTVSFKNLAPQNMGDKGIYKNYLRFILPLNTTISNIQINNQEQKIITAITDPTVYEKKGFVPPSGLEVQKDQQSGKDIYGFLVNIQPQELKTIKIKYVLAQKINTNLPQLGYKLQIFKQPGVDVLPYDFSLNFPANLKTVNSDKDIKTSSQNALLSAELDQDREVQVNFSSR